MKPSLVGRLMLAYAAVIAALLLSTWWSLRSLADAEVAVERLSQRSVEGIELTAKLETLVREKARLANYLLSHDPTGLADLAWHRNRFQGWIDEMGDFAHTDEEHALLTRMREAYTAYTTEADTVIALEQAGRTDQARQHFAATSDQIEHVLADSQQLFTLAEGDMRARRTRAEDEISRGRGTVAWLSGAGALFSLALGFLLSRYAARPIYDLVLRLGTSGIVDRVRVDGDEIGVLEAQVNALLERVRQQERALHQAEKLSELGEIASEIAHETLNPVTGVKGMLQALRRTTLPPEQVQGALVDMERQLGRVADTVRRLMRYARPLEPRVRTVGVRTVLLTAAGTARLAPAVRERTIRVAAVPDEVAWPMDPDLIQQVLVNLLVNGCEASPPGGCVELAAEIADGALHLVVRDHGSGISPKIRERLFHPFVTTKPNGNGLGLAVSRNIVREHGGQIDVTSAEDHGTIFRIWLPAGEEAACASRS